MANIAIVELTAAEAAAAQNGVLSVYSTAFAPPPYSKTASDMIGFSDAFGRHLEREGFRFFAALRSGAIPSAPGEMVGFVYGYTSRPGQWWHDTIAHKLDPEQISYWLSDAFEFVELAVDPEAQGQGIGGKLHDSILAGLPHRTAMLSTLQVETTGLKLYQKRGWQTLMEHFHFATTLQPYRIMGRALREEPQQPSG